LRNRDLASWLDRLVRTNRFTIAVVFPVVGAMLLLATATGLSPVPALVLPVAILGGTLVMRLPLIAGSAALVTGRAVVALLAVVVYTYAIEFVGLRTGWPYGDFVYGLDLGPAVGGVPITLPLFFVPLVVDGLLLSILVLGGWARRRALRLPIAIGFVLLIDLILDPAAVAVGFWSYADGGYYGVPPSNYAGWLLSASVAVTALDLGVDRQAIEERIAECPYLLDDVVSFVLLWGTINVASGQWLPVALAFGIGALLHRHGRLDLLGAVTLSFGTGPDSDTGAAAGDLAEGGSDRR
jgi:putative membrane protein